MDYLTHAWIALRATKLLEDEGQSPELVAILKAHGPMTLAGAWLPDQTSDSGRAEAGSECHILKFDLFPMTDPLKSRFVVNRDKFLDGLGSTRAMPDYIRNAGVLDQKWWDQAYKGDVKSPGQHVVNRAQAFSLTMLDLLVLGDAELCGHTTKIPTIAKSVERTALTSEAEAVFHFFILSHLVADSGMPCHCDARLLSKCGNGLHNVIEDRWHTLIQNTYTGKPTPCRDKATEGEMEEYGDYVYQNVTSADSVFGIDFNKPKPTIPDLGNGNDVWLELMQVCRASFAIASIIADPVTYPYGGSGLAPFDKVFPKENGQDSQKLKDFDRTIMHDAVLNVAIVWKHVWKAVCPK